MNRADYKKCIAEALCPEYDAMLSEATDEHVFSSDFEKKMQRLFDNESDSSNSSENSIRDKLSE